MIERCAIDDIYPDPKNPRESDDARLHLLRLSLQKLGFVHPIYVNRKGMILSGHQRHRVSGDLGYEYIPVERCDLKPSQEKGINVLFNRATNDMTAFDTGRSAMDRIEIGDLMVMAEALPDCDDDFYAYHAVETDIRGLGSKVTDDYNRKALLITATLRRYGIRIPIVMTDEGEIVNGIHRLFDARHEGIETWPVVTIPHEHATLAANLLNYLSMDYAVDGEFATMLRYSAYRRPQNARGTLPKGMRFWAAGERTIPDSEAYTEIFWKNFRSTHGRSILDFGSGLSKVAPYLNAKGFQCVDFEPYRLAMERDRNDRTAEESTTAGLPAGRGSSEERSSTGDGVRRRSRNRRNAVSTGAGRRKRTRRVRDGLDRDRVTSGGNSQDTGQSGGRPDPVYSRECAREFLHVVAEGRKFDSIFLASVLNSIPFPRDRQCVLAIVHALSSFETITYGTCRDISDFLYEYSGVRNATYFVFDSEPGVRLGDALSNPKIQKFHTEQEFKEAAGFFWNRVETWKGGNIFYWRCSAPKRINHAALRSALEFEFELPYADGTTMGLSDEALRAFSERLQITL